MVVPSVFVFVQRVEVSLTVLLPLHTEFQKEVFSGEIQILDKAKLRIWTQVLWREHEKNLWDSCTGAAAQSVQPMLGTHKLALVLGPGEWDPLVETKGLGFGPHLPPAEGLCGH